MRSRKSILNKGIVFVMSVFAFMLFSFTKISAACEVSFSDGNQYLTLGGNISNWNDTRLKSSGCDITITSLTINGKVVQGEEGQSPSFIPTGAGHYTIGYNYKYNDGGNDVEGVIYRYVRVLNSNLGTSNNYNAVTFDFDDTASATVIDSFLVSDYYFANFVVHGNSTYVVIKNSLGKQAINGVMELKVSDSSFVATKVIKSNNDYYLIGNNSDGNGSLVGYKITLNDGTASIATLANVNYTSNTSVYYGGYLDGAVVYLAGQNKDGEPIIDKFESSGTSNYYTYEGVLGAYNSVLSSNNTVYAVGYTKTTTISTGLYTYISALETPLHRSIINDAETIFYDIVKYDNQNIIVGKSEVNSISANNVLAATNTRQGFSDGVILRVSNDGQNITGAYMLGGNVHDEFTSIKLINGSEYVVVGKMNDGTASLVYRLDASKFEATVDVTSNSSSYKINGITSWNYGYVYYGEIYSNAVLGVYYPLNGSNNADALFVTLDNRGFEDYQTLAFTTSETQDYKYCNYPIKFGLDNYNSLECNDNKDFIDVSKTGTSLMTYVIDAKTGVVIVIYRNIKITQEPEPIDLNSNTSMGILKWYTYNRTSTNSSVNRIPTTDFNYIFNGSHENETIEDMINYYFENGNTNGYELRYVDNPDLTHKTFTKSDQSSAAFATIEYAKMFAYYQEFSRIVKVSGGIAYDDLSAEKYPGETIIPGTAYYIYYIDYKGANATGTVKNCDVTKTLIGNCSAKGGYVFASLNSIKKVIENLLVYNDFFVNSRNTIYNGSIDASEIETYKQSLTTKEYVKSLGFVNNQTQLNFNVKNDSGTITYYSGTGKNVYFGGVLSKDQTTGTLSVTHSLSGKQTVNPVTVEGLTYYESNSYIFFTHNACYSVMYSNSNNKSGSPRYFCLDTMGPIIEYKKDSSDSVATQSPDASKGVSPEQPIYIESDFTITDLIDIDDYAFISVNGNRYPIECGNYNSKTCLEDVEKYIKQSFRYDSENPNKIQTIEFSDRLSNKNTFYFVIGTLAPSISVEDESDDGFTLVIDFYQTNPIQTFKGSVFHQTCATEGAINCYDPIEGDDKLDINFDIDEFNQAVINYIYAINYRDNTNAIKEVKIIEGSEGVYNINGIDYIIEDGYFVESAGYKQSYSINSENLFEYNGKMYAYDALSKSIQLLEFNEETDEFEIVDGSKIVIINDVFKFEENGRLYTIVSGNNGLSVETLAQRYPIYGDEGKENKFKLNDVEYTIDFEAQTLTYINPELSDMKRISIKFFRTTNDNMEATGVEIPKTQLILDDEGEIVKDEITGLYAYEILEEEKWHFNVVDGVYTFIITHDFAPGIDMVETKINVVPLELNIGFASYVDGLGVVKGKILEYDQTYDEGQDETVLFLTRLVDQFTYPLASDIVASSNLSTYQNTHFLNKTVYFSYPRVSNNDKNVLIIRVYNIKNDYGLPSTDNATVCTEVVIYGNNLSRNDLISTVCGDVIAFKYSQVSENASILESLGINKLTFGEKAEFALNGENVFYDIYLKAFDGDDGTGEYYPAGVTSNKSVYLDSKAPDNDTIHAYVYDEVTETEVPGFEFELDADSGVYRANKTLGSTKNVAININWYVSSIINDYRENKLMLMTIGSGGEGTTCNLFQLLNNPNYTTDCRNYIDVDKSYSNSGDFKLVFSTNGTYYITFTDASGNSVSYEFMIDKAAPTVILTGASMEVDGSDQLLAYAYDQNYYVKEYVKNPKFNMAIEDSSEIAEYCYYFDYGQAEKNKICPAYIDNNILIIMNEYEGIKAYLEDNNRDQNIILVIWATDNEGNTGEATPTKVLFWVDYQEPEVTYTQTNLNMTTVGNVSGDLSKVTIAVATGEYSGKNIICDSKNGFSFVDHRYKDTEAPYTFVLNCNDLHNAGKDDYPNTYGFNNTMYIKFYEWDDATKTRGDMFNFGQETKDGYARWIYITVVDVVGNESNDFVLLPISIVDRVNPTVVKGEKEVDGVREILPAIDYAYDGIHNAPVYLANDKIIITFSESIATVVSCTTVIASRDPNNGQIIKNEYPSCVEYINGQQFEYSDTKLEFAFDNDESDTYKLIIFEVADFATLTSGKVIVVIDKLAPVINWTSGGGDDSFIEYISGKDVYGSSYAGSGYNSHVNVEDDQKTVNLQVTVSYTKYVPSITYNNYVYNKNTKTYNKVADGTTRELNTIYYLLVESSSLVNKKCEKSIIKDGKSYCFVEDTQSYYYFDRFFNDESGNIWKDITQIDSSSIGVYRIAYFVTDYSGNISNTIYKKVFVNDTRNPDIDIYTGDGTNRLFYDVAGSNGGNFGGKLNSESQFRGTDSAAIGENTRLALYQCGIDNYKNGYCDITNQGLFNEPGANIARKFSTNNVLIAGTNNGIYKLFVYDIGSYKNLDTESIYYHEDDAEGKVYSLTHNTAYVYFAVNKTEPDSNYTIYGNILPNSKEKPYLDGSFNIVHSKTNYFTISNSAGQDVYLVRYINGSYTDIYGNSMIGASNDKPIIEGNADSSSVVFKYTDSEGRVIYKIEYQKYENKGLLLHETYHKINFDTLSVDVCKIVNGENECNNLETVYKLYSMEATVYVDGEYTLQLKDRYGNYSKEMKPILIDNTPYTENKENTKATGINYWFSVPSRVVTSADQKYFSELRKLSDRKDINVLDGIFEGNFNTSFFYAFASREDAKKYLNLIYTKEISRQLEHNNGIFTFCYTDGNCTDAFDSVDDISNQLEEMIFTSYVPNSNFSDSKMKQIAYDGKNLEGFVLSSSMYKYAYLLKKESIEYNKNTKRDEYTYTYEYKGSSCEVTSIETEECIKVDLSIMNKNESINLNVQPNDSITLHCLMAGTTGDSTGTDSNCNGKVTSGATYLFIEIEEREYHRNVVYYGITAYTEETYIEYAELGDYIPLSQFLRYSKDGNDYKQDNNGDYIWLDSKFVNLESIRNTNLLIKGSEVCTFNTVKYDECVFVTYLGRYQKNGENDYFPSNSGNWFYNYYDGLYYDGEDAIMDKLGVDSTYSDNGNRSEDTNGEYVPIKITISEGIKVGFESTLYKQTNKKMYIELFNSENTSIDTTIFEINAIKKDGKYSEVYSYATLIINSAYYNINRYITFNDNSYKCVVDIDINSKYVIQIIDRAGNTLNLEFSHSNYVPDITYRQDSESTTSNVYVDVETKSSISGFNKDFINVYKYTDTKNDLGVVKWSFEKYENIDSQCVFYESNIDASYFTSKLVLRFEYNKNINCSGVYRIEVKDNHGNSRFKDVVFNPYDINTSYNLDNNNIHEYTESDINGVLVNNQIRVDVDSSLYYMIIKKYPSNTNLELDKLADKLIQTVVLDDFSADKEIGDNCKVVVSKYALSVYSVYIYGEKDHSCDGIYTIDLVNKFSETIIDLGLTHLDGANSEVIQSRVTYGASSTVEIDTTAPKGDIIGSEYYFHILVDEEESDEDTLEIINNGSKTYTNKFITVYWGGSKAHSFTYLKYRVKEINGNDTTWSLHTDGANYSGEYNSKYLFKYTSDGVYQCEFMFSDVLGNEDASKIYTIIITIEAPKIGFFEVEDNPNEVGREYAQFNEDGERVVERIADRTILKCLVEIGSAYVPENCNKNDYKYVMKVNSVEYPFYSDFLNSIIHIDSLWLNDTYRNDRNIELNIHLVASVKDKDSIRTELFIIIDKKAPDITLGQTPTQGTTYTGSVEVSIKSNTDIDTSNTGIIYKCDVINDDPIYNKSECLMYDNNKNLVVSNKVVEVLENNNYTATIGDSNSGYFMIIAKDQFGNESRKWFTLDNQAPTIAITGNGVPIAQNMYTNANSVFVEVKDNISQAGSSFEIEFTPLNSEDSSDIVYNHAVGLSKEGKYVLTPKDGVGIEGRGITFYIYRQTPIPLVVINDDLTISSFTNFADALKQYLAGEDKDVGYRVGEKVFLMWDSNVAPENAKYPELYAPIVSVTLNGRIYEANYDNKFGAYIGKTITDIGEYTFVLTDAAGNRKVIMVAINNTSKVCINGKVMEVKMQAYYDINNLKIGSEDGITYQKDDVIIFALPSGSSSSECIGQGLLSYRTLDNKNSHYLIENDKNAELFNKYKYDFVDYGFISSKAIDEVKNVGGTVVVFVVTKDVANNQLGYHVGTNFFMEDPVGWSMIFVSLLGLVWPTCRIFIKKKVRII